MVLSIENYQISLLNIVTRYKILFPRREFIFHTCENGAAWHLIPRRISPR